MILPSTVVWLAARRERKAIDKPATLPPAHSPGYVCFDPDCECDQQAGLP